MADKGDDVGSKKKEKIPCIQWTRQCGSDAIDEEGGFFLWRSTMVRCWSRRNMPAG
jgi:hypothetical protein